MRSRNLCPIGVPGELCIGGDGVALGYWNRPELTAERFIPDPFSATPGATLYRTGDLARWRNDGTLEHLGRLDFQVKIRGFRIELGEIETAIARYPAVRETVVIVREDVPGDQRLVAYVVAQKPEPSTQRSQTASTVRGQVALLYGAVCLRRLDRPAAHCQRQGRSPSASRPRPARPNLERAFVAPRTPVEEVLVGIWSEVLGIKQIGINDNFFDLGGVSLLGTRVMSRLRHAFQVDLPLGWLFEAPTVAGLAMLIASRQAPREGRASPSSRSLIAIQPAGSRPPIFAVPGVGGNVLCYSDLARLTGPQQPFYGLQSRGLSGTEKPLTSIEDIAAAFLEEIRGVRPKGPYNLVGACMGGMIAYEMTHQLRAAGHAVDPHSHRYVASANF